MKTNYDFGSVGIELFLGNIAEYKADLVVLPHDSGYKIDPQSKNMIRASEITDPDMDERDTFDIYCNRIRGEVFQSMINILDTAKSQNRTSIALPLLRTEPFYFRRAPRSSLPEVVEEMTKGLATHFKKVSPIRNIALVVDRALHFSAADKVLEKKFQRVFR